MRVFIVAFIFGSALPVMANPVVAVAAVTYPLFLLGLVPVIALEAWILRAILRDSWARVFKASGLANVCSTFFGIPLAWFLQRNLQTATIGFEPSLADASHKPPSKLLDYLFGAAYSYGGDYWDIQIKAVVGLGVAYAVAVFSEYGVYTIVLKGNESAKLRRCARLANAATYAPLFVLLGALIIRQLITGKPDEAYYDWLDGVMRAFRRRWGSTP